MADTLTISSTSIEAWRTDASYDYDTQFVRSDRSLMDILTEEFRKIMESLFGNDTYSNYQTEIWMGIAIVLLIAVFLFLVWRHPELFSRTERQEKLDYETSDDNIYGVDFDLKIAEAMERQNFREAVRLRYLQTLRLLHDNELISWQPFKTPSQYTRELDSAHFRQMTNHFLRVRYGDFPADEALASLMDSLQEQIVEQFSIGKEAADEGQ